MRTKCEPRRPDTEDKLGGSEDGDDLPQPNPQTLRGQGLLGWEAADKELASWREFHYPE